MKISDASDKSIKDTQEVNLNDAKFNNSSSSNKNDNENAAMRICSTPENRYGDDFLHIEVSETDDEASNSPKRSKVRQGEIKNDRNYSITSITDVTNSCQQFPANIQNTKTDVEACGRQATVIQDIANDTIESHNKNMSNEIIAIKMIESEIPLPKYQENKVEGIKLCEENLQNVDINNESLVDLPEPYSPTFSEMFGSDSDPYYDEDIIPNSQEIWGTTVRSLVKRSISDSDSNVDNDGPQSLKKNKKEE